MSYGILYHVYYVACQAAPCAEELQIISIAANCMETECIIC